MKEKELYKQIKSRMRAIELMKKSKLPHNMELQEEKRKLEEERNRLFMEEMTRLQQEVEEKELTRKHPRKSYEIPDYDALYRKFIIELETKKAHGKKNTKTEPFVLRSSMQARKCRHEHPEEAKSIVRSSSMSRLSELIILYR
jgi:hypothetical protein